MPNRYQFLPDELIGFFRDYAEVQLIEQRARWSLEKRFVSAFARDPSQEKKFGLFGAFSRESHSGATTAYAVEVASGVCSYFVVPTVPETYALECAGKLPTFDELTAHFGSNWPSDLMIADGSLTWVFAVFRENDGTAFARVNDDNV